MNTALFDGKGRFLGHSVEVAHHTTGSRAWCLEGLSEWCYPGTPCDSCQRAIQGDPWEIVAALRAQVQAVREWAETNDCGCGDPSCRGYAAAARVLRRILDGGDA